MKKLLRKTMPENMYRALKGIYYNARHKRMEWTGMYSLRNEYRPHVQGRNIYLIGTPQAYNLGDIAIAEFEIDFLKKHAMEGYRIYDIPLPRYYSHKGILKRTLKDGDIICVTGGGHMGAEWLDEAHALRDCVKSFVGNRVIVMPQTIYYGDSGFARRELERSVRIYSRHPDLHIFAREKISYEIMKRHYPVNNIHLAPDIVLSQSRMEPRHEREGILICFRQDEERSPSRASAEKIAQICEGFGERVLFTDMLNRHGQISPALSKDHDGLSRLHRQRQEGIPLRDRAEVLDQKFTQFKKARLVITDRLHGMIFAAITGTPCIAYSNYNHKIRGVYDWIADLGYIRYMEPDGDIGEAIGELLEAAPGEYDENAMAPSFGTIAEALQFKIKDKR